MKTVGMKDSIIKPFREGIVLRTNCLNPLIISQEDVSECDKGIISDLDQNGLLVYHVLFSNFMIGKKTEIMCEHEVCSYENVVTVNNYLCVPKDIFAESVATDADVTSDSNREEVTKEYIEHITLMANQGYLYAYVVRKEDNISEFYNIEVNILDGNLIMVN